MKSAIASYSAKAGRGYAENTGMGSLDVVHKTLGSYIPKVQRKHVIHVACGVICPVRALGGSPDYHSNNGIYLATVGEVVYALCPSCVFVKSGPSKKRAVVDIVPGMEEKRRPWVVYTEEDYGNLVRMASISKTHPAAKKAKKTGV